MPTVAEHVGKAERNEAFAGSFDPAVATCLDWIITIYFYAALHYVRAVAAANGVQIADYGGEDNAFRSVRVLRDSTVFRAYRQLKDDSREARYGMQPFAPTDIVQARDDHFRSVRIFARRILRLPGPSSPPRTSSS